MKREKGWVSEQAKGSGFALCLPSFICAISQGYPANAEREFSGRPSLVTSLGAQER